MYQKKRMSANELRQFAGYEQLTDEQAEETIQVLEELADLFIGLYQTKREVLERAISKQPAQADQPKTIPLNPKSNGHDDASAA